MPVIWGWRKLENFCTAIWTGNITLFAQPFFLFWRNGIAALPAKSSTFAPKASGI
jgi:hypothetical protein